MSRRYRLGQSREADEMDSPEAYAREGRAQSKRRQQSAERLLTEIEGHDSDAMLRLPDPAAERELAQAAARFAQDPAAAPQALELSAEPRVEAVLLPNGSQPAAASSLPVVQVLCRLPRPRGGMGAALLAQLSGLPRREAELALRLSQGRSIAEAAQDMGLTLETARNYSKRIYAQLGLRGQAELVRYVFESGAILA